MLAGNTDPEKVGERLMRYRQLNPDLTCSQVADMIPWDDPDLTMTDDENSGMRAARDRQAELQRRAEQGDRFAIALLAGDSLAEDPVD